ncbi:MAG: TonB-dependent receptor [Novosphingobium sp.]|uniref:TonB-dependent receptor n=1 Tax=Novosphingobium sp. TaxID=1874826 RepID=UPI003B9B2F2A
MQQSTIKGGAGLLALALATTAHAQDGAPEQQDGGIAEIVVTAQKRAEPLQKTPLSIVALTSDDIAKKGIADLTDLRSQVPSLQITPHPNSATTARVFLRGVGNNDDQITVDPSVAIYLDGVYVARGQGLAAEIAEVERIEVLRGPQGSLYGRNATGGAINYITRQPTLGEFHARQTLAYGNYDQFRSRTSVNVPVGNTLAVELAYLHSQKDGFVRNPGTGVARFGDQRRDAWRAAVLWQPAPAFEVRYAYDRSDIADTPAFMVSAPFYPLLARRPTAGSPAVRGLKANDVTAQGHGLTASWTVSDALTVKSITGYRKLANYTNQNYLTGVAGPFPVFLTEFQQTQRQWSEELQLVGSTFDSQLEYTLGAYFFDEKASSFDSSVPAGRATSLRTATVHNRAWALYGQATWRPAMLDGAYLTGGLRWSQDNRKATLDQSSVALNGTVTTRPQGSGDNTFTDYSPSVIIGYEASRDVNLYAKWSRGYKSGGYNLRASTIARFAEGYGPERLDSFEVGVKSSWLDNRLRANIALFRANYRDIQVNIQSDPANPAVTDIFNAGEARIQGLELDITAKPSRALTFNASYAFLDAGYRRITDQVTGANIAGRFNFVEAPRHTLTVGAEWTLPETPLGLPSASVDYYMQSRKFSSTTDARYVIGDYGILSARIALSGIPVGFGKWQLAAYGRNLTDTKYYLAHFSAGLPAAFFGDPRSYGLELRFEY